MSNKDDLRYAEASLRVVADHTRKLRAPVAERQAFVAARTPKY